MNELQIAGEGGTVPTLQKVREQQKKNLEAIIEVNRTAHQLLCDNLPAVERLLNHDGKIQLRREAMAELLQNGFKDSQLTGQVLRDGEVMRAYARIIPGG